MPLELVKLREAAFPARSASQTTLKLLIPALEHDDHVDQHTLVSHRVVPF